MKRKTYYKVVLRRRGKLMSVMSTVIGSHALEYSNQNLARAKELGI